MQIISVPFSHSLVETERLKLHCDRDATDRLEFILKDFFFHWKRFVSVWVALMRLKQIRASYQRPSYKKIWN